jgi:tripartite-type tricarboxylate transporter receptor subunit TctC
MIKRHGRLMAAVVLAAVPTATLAQSDYPVRTIRIVVPAPPGTTLDALPRIIADRLAVRWGKPVIIENRPGASQNLGAEVVAKAEPNGYTLLATPMGPLVISQHLFPKLGFNPGAFMPVSIIVRQPAILVAYPKAPFSTAQDLIAFAKTNPNKVNYGSPGTGSSLHLIAEVLQSSSGIRLVHVPYKGMAPAMSDLLAGHISMTVDVLGNALPYIKEGKLKALGVTSETRVPELPDIAAITETIPGFIFIEWFAFVAPPKTQFGIVAKFSQAVAETLQQPEVVKRFRDLSVTPAGTTPAETAAFINQEAGRWHKVVLSSGVKLD